MKNILLSLLFVFSFIILTGQVSKTIQSTNAGTLSTELSSEELNSITNLTIIGNIDARDFKTMRDLMPVLAEIDLKEVDIVAYEGLEGTSTQGIYYPANAIPANAFYIAAPIKYGKESLTSIIIPQTITSIGDYAFNRCVKLNSFFIPQNVNSIGPAALWYGPVNIEVDINNSVYSGVDGVLFNKEKSALLYCPATKTGSYSIPFGVVTIQEFAFTACKNISSFIIPSSVKKIGVQAFEYCSISSITIPLSVNSIGDYAFVDCSNLTSITVGWNTPLDLNYSIGVFDGIDKTSCSLFVPNGTANLYANADQWKDFQNIVEMEPTVTMPLTVTAGGLAALLPQSVRDTLTYLVLKGTIDARDFKTMRDDMPLLAEVDLSGVSIVEYNGNEGTSQMENTFYNANIIPEFAFLNNQYIGKSSLTKIIFPDNIIGISRYALCSCSNINPIYFKLPSLIKSIDDYALAGIGFTNFTILESVEYIGTKVFDQCRYLSEINVSDLNKNYSSIDGVLFNKEQTELIHYPNGKQSSVYNIPSSVIRVLDYSFDGGNGSLNIINIPNGIEEIGQSAFANLWNIQSFDIPSSIVTIKDNAFGSCPDLISIYIKVAVPLTLDPYNFDGANKSIATLYVPFGAKSAYQNASVWKDFQNIVEMEPTYEMPLEVTAGGLAALLPQSVRDTLTYLALKGTIDARDFKTMRESMPLLKNIDLSNVQIQSYNGTEGTSEFVTTYDGNAIPDYAFWNRSTHKELVNIETFVFPENVESIGTNAFRFCSGISSISMPESVVFIGSQAFQNCNGIVSLNLPQNLISISNSAFSTCENLETVNFSNQLKSIGEMAFSWCPKLTTIKMPATVTSIGGGAFLNCTALSSIYAEPQTPPEETISANGPFDFFYGVNKSTCTLYVAIGSASKYATSRYWQDFQNIVEIAPSYQMPLQVTAGGLAALLPQAVRDTLAYLALTGTIDARDFKTMRDSLPVLTDLDLSDVNIEEYTGSEGTSITGNTSYPANTIPEMAFMDSNWVGKTSLKYVILPNSLKEIGRNAFRSCSNLIFVFIPEGVISIGLGAFQYCSNDISIKIPSTVSNIGLVAFVGYGGKIWVDTNNQNYSSIDGILYDKAQTTIIQCPTSKTGNFEIPANVTTIGYGAFWGCSGLSEISIPVGVKSMLGSAFYYCSGLYTVYANSPIPIDLNSSNNIFDGINKPTCTLYVPFGSKAAYQAADQWKDFQNIVEMPKVDLSSGLVAYYPFNGNANDESGNGNNGTANAVDQTTDRFGNSGKAFTFDGTSSFVTGNINDLSTNSTSIWFKCSDSDFNRYQQIIDFGQEQVQLGICNSYDNDNSCAGSVVYSPSNAQIWNCSSAPNQADGKWHHAVAIYSEEKSTYSLYVDNVHWGNKVLTNMINPFNYFDIGRSNSPCCGYWQGTMYKGDIDDVRIYSRELSASEIDSLYHEDGWPLLPKQYAVYDVDGNGYDTVKIGDQTWLKQNLYVTKYNDGTPIPNVTDGPTWANLQTPAYSWFNNDNNYAKKYGAYYNWYVVDSISNGGKNVCPEGWEIPSLNQWHELANFLGGRDIAGGKMKVTGTEYWMEPNEGATNESGFSSIGASGRIFDDGSFAVLHGEAYFWNKEAASISNAYQQYMTYGSTIFQWQNTTKTKGSSIRCAKCETKNLSPTANAGSDQVVDEGEEVILDGTLSYDIEGDSLGYVWAAPLGIELSDASSPKPSFTAPEVTLNTDYIFSLVVNDGKSNSVSDSVIIKVLDIPCPQHFHTVWEGTSGTDQMNINIVGAKYDGIDLESGDEIGVFDGDKCVGYGKLTGPIDLQNILSVKVSRDDGTGNGFAVGNEVTYRIWDCSGSAEYEVKEVTCYDTELNAISCSPFEASGTSFVELSGRSEECLTLDYRTGWNLFSVPVEMDTTNMLDVFNLMIAGKSLVKIQDEMGSSLENWGIFGGWKNNIGDVRLTEGYKIKVTRPDSIRVCGSSASYPYAIPLQLGWNIIGYPQIGIYDASAVMQQLIDRKTLIKVQDEMGSSLENWGIFGGWKNNIGSFNPGEGYKVKVNAKDTLWINESYPKSSVIQPEYLATTHFKPGFSGNGVDHMNINVVELPLNVMQTGDELAVFDGETCVGAITVMPHHLQSQSVAIAASATDNQGVPGFVDGEKFTLKIWNSTRDEEYQLEPEIIEGTPVFAKHETTVASLEKYVTTGFEVTNEAGVTKVNCYPNPFSDEVTIEIDLKSDAGVEVEVLNQLGQRVSRLLTSQEKNAGLHRINWYGTNSMGQRVLAGMYHLRVRIGDTEYHRKLVLSE